MIQRANKDNYNGHNNQKFIQRVVKPSPLRPEEISKFKMNSKEKIHNLQIAKHFKEKVTVNAQSNNPLIKNKSKVEIRFPIKIDNF